MTGEDSENPYRSPLWSGSGEIYTPLTPTARQEGKIVS